MFGRKEWMGSSRGVANAFGLGVLAVIALLALVIAFLVYPAYVVAILVLLLGLGLTTVAAWRFPSAAAKTAGVIGGIVLMILGVVLAIVAASARALSL